MKEKIIKRANKLWKDGAAMGSGWDSDNPMTELNEAIAFLVLEDSVLSDEISGENLYYLLNKVNGLRGALRKLHTACIKCHSDEDTIDRLIDKMVEENGE